MSMHLIRVQSRSSDLTTAVFLLSRVSSSEPLSRLLLLVSLLVASKSVVVGFGAD